MNETKAAISLPCQRLTSNHQIDEQKKLHPFIWAVAANRHMDQVAIAVYQPRAGDGMDPFTA